MADAIAEGAKALLRILADEHCQIPSGTAIVSCLETESLASVLARVMAVREDPPVVVSVYWPESGRLELVQLGEGAHPLANNSAPDEVSSESTIGMLVDAIRTNSAFQFKVMTKAGSVLQSANVLAHR